MDFKNLQFGRIEISSLTVLKSALHLRSFKNVKVIKGTANNKEHSIKFKP